jgi:hypothetical protein
MRSSLFCLHVLLLLLCASAQEREGRAALSNSFDMRLGSTPAHDHFNGETAAVYELH